jgi:hypothetical protein
MHAHDSRPDKQRCAEFGAPGNSLGIDTPDLRSRFVVGYDSRVTDYPRADYREHDER